MAISLLTTTAKLYFQDKGFGGKQLDEVLFPMLDEAPASTIKIDRYTGTGFAASSVINGQPSQAVQYAPGSGYEYEVRRTKRKTAIDEDLSDAVIAGLEANAPASQHMARLVSQIIDGPKGFIAAFKMARIKAAMDVLVEGKMVHKDEDGNSHEVDFSRDSSLTKTYDFSTSGNNVDKALKAQVDAMRAFGMPTGNLAVIMGANWIQELENDTNVQVKRRANSENVLIRTSIMPPLVEGAEGLNFIGTYRPAGVSQPIAILTYTPAWQYVATSGATAADFLDASKMVMFGLGNPAWRCNRGVRVYGSNGKPVTVAGDLVLDNFSSDDPVIEWLRAQARFFYVPGNVNHTSVCTGSNFN